MSPATAVRPRVERARAIPLLIPMAGGRRYQATVLVLDAEGLTGLGEAPALPARGHPPEQVQADAEAAAAGLESGGPVSPRLAPVRCAVETALLDLEARAAGAPLARLLGDARRDGVDCNALVGSAGPARVAAEVESWASGGFTTFKLKSFDQGGPADLERLGAARWAAGVMGRIRLDFNGGMPPTAAPAAIAGLGHLRLDLAEQPLPADAGIHWWRRLAEIGLPLAADESLGDPRLAGFLCDEEVCLAIKVATVGGPGASLRLAARATGPVLIASSYETSIGLAAGLHAACALRRDPPACGLATRHLLEADIATGLAAGGPRLALPGGSGLGVELDRGALARYRRDT
ncbi:MAG: mandelate racemase/muconate lactonizing enzyme family protein [Candidatus Dormibacteraceae bacterium]